MISSSLEKPDQEITAISIPFHGFPKITRGTYDDMVKTYFFQKQVHYIILNKLDFVIVSPNYFNDAANIIYLATTIYRSFKPYESSFHDIIYGPVLFVGKKDEDSNLTSVSQQTIESVLNVYTRDLYGIDDVS